MTTATKTFNEMLADGYAFPEIIPESLQETITDWFGLRHVVNNEKFKRFFDRILYRDYHRYNEQLRIEAGAGMGMTAGYDWLVNMYMEKEIKNEEHSEDDNGRKDTMTGNVTDVSTPRATLKTTVTDTKEFDSSEEFTHGHKVQYDPHSHRMLLRGDYSNTINSTERNATSTSGNATNTSKATPASVIGTYSDGTAGGVSIVDDTPQPTLGATPAWDTELSAPTAISKSVNNAAGMGATVGETVNAFVQTTADDSYGTGTDETRNSGKDVNEHKGKDTDTIVTEQERDGTDQLVKTYNTENEIIQGGSRDGYSQLHEIYTGRGGENMATALTKAREYIQSTSAWEWLSNQLEPCFMAVYDI